MDRREQLQKAIELAEEFTRLLYELDFAGSPSMADRGTIHFWKKSLMQDLASLEADLKRNGVAKFQFESKPRA